MATAKKLPSGSYRCQIYDYTDDNGKRHYKSFTAATKKEAEYLATSFKLEETATARGNLTVGKATEQYINNRLSILSPTTVRTYTGIANNQISKIAKLKIDSITQEQIQVFINSIAGTVSPKTIRNIHGLLNAVIRTYRPNFALKTDLPKKVQPDIHIPSDDEVKQLLTYAKGTELEIPILLAAFGPMRRGEICALEASDINGNIVHVKNAMVKAPDRSWVIKAPKTYSSDRYIEFPDFVIDLLPEEGKITNLHPNMITDRFANLLKKAGLKHFRFHDLRHYSASILHAMGIPDKYIMERGGWSTSSTLKTVYQHTMRGKNKEINKRINDYFESMQHEMQHE